jgi:hypothetical protein
MISRLETSDTSVLALAGQLERRLAKARGHVDQLATASLYAPIMTANSPCDKPIILRSSQTASCRFGFIFVTRK